MIRKKATPTWLYNLRKRLEEYPKDMKVKFKSLSDVKEFVKPILEEGEKEEEYMTKSLHKDIYGSCDCDICGLDHY